MENQFERHDSEFEVRNSINKKRKGGRPALQHDQRLAVRISIGYTEREAIALSERAELAGVSDIKFIKQISLNQPFKTIPVANRQFLIELNRIGNNINQIAHKANASGSLTPDIHQALEKLQTEISKIGKAICGVAYESR